jgi:hypothetical protein
MDRATLEGWIGRFGYDTTTEDDKTLRLHPRGPDAPSLPPFFAQCGENWVLLSMLPVLAATDPRPDDLPQRLLSVNGDMRLVKFALGQNDEVVLCAELPTESLDEPELSDAIDRMVKYYAHYREYILG